MTRAKDISKIVTDANLSGTLDVTGEVNLSANLNLGDNDKAIFGAGNDLQIYHDGGNSLIDDSGGGNLILKGSTSIVLRGSASGDLLAKFNDGSDVELYYGNAEKLATTSSGIDVTGTATMDAFQVESSTVNLYLMESDTTDLNTLLRSNGGNFTVQTISDDKGTTTPRFKIENSTGDISFYEDTGTTPKFFWDASAESLGIGTTTPNTTNLNSGTTSGIVVKSGGVAKNNFVALPSTGGSQWDVRESGGSGGEFTMRMFDTSGTHNVQISSNGNHFFNGGNVGIGNSAPQELVHLQKTGGSTIRFQNTGTRVWSIGNDSTSFVFDDVTAGSERMRIDSSGNFMVGTTDTLPSNDTSGSGIALRSDGIVGIATSNTTPLRVNRTGNDGDIIKLHKDGSEVGNIGTPGNSDVYIADTGVGLRMSGSGTIDVFPCNGSGAALDNVADFGASGARFDDIYATNGTIQTSDQQEKNTITESDLGIDFIKRLSPKSYIFNGKTRTHYGLIAQDVETVLSDISKPTSGFAGFIKDDISEEQDGSQYRYGLRYTEFVAPLIQAVKDQQATIDALTARITALENGE